jgi:pimeloyl-ACP methyl ester carboxylesterase
MPGAVLTEREHSVPLVHGDPSRGTISVFTRELAAPDGLDRPCLVYLQGGPGFEASRPTSPPSGWVACALADAELGVDRWSLLGQSFGGFTSLTYLPLAPEGLREILITGGLAPITNRPVDEVYAATWARVREANQRYHDRYPGDLDRLRAIVRRLDEQDVRLPNGDRLTSRRLRQTGMWLGDSAEETARGVRGLRASVTNEYAHNGLRADGERVLGRLLDMVRGRA